MLITGVGLMFFYMNKEIEDVGYLCDGLFGMSSMYEANVSTLK